MRHTLVFCSIVLFSILSLHSSAQKTCQVLLPEIDSIYKGKCKKGYAHGKGEAIGVDKYSGKFVQGLPSGKGTYTWANGDQYKGSWRTGKRDGEGILVLKLEERDSIIDGVWEENIYVGPKPIAPKIISKVSIDRYTIRKNGAIQDRVLINFMQNGTRNTTITNFSISSSSGVETNLGHSIGYEYIDFPVKIRIIYMTMNKLRSEEYQAIFEFEIHDRGDWLVEIHN